MLIIVIEGSDDRGPEDGSNLGFRIAEFGSQNPSRDFSISVFSFYLPDP
jgi:hypothetical protein